MNLQNFSFSDFSLLEDETLQAAICMFEECNLINKFHVPYDVSLISLPLRLLFFWKRFMQKVVNGLTLAEFFLEAKDLKKIIIKSKI